MKINYVFSVFIIALSGCNRESTFTRRVAIEYRNAWRIRTWVFDVYVDAITGEDLNYAEQTVIF